MKGEVVELLIPAGSLEVLKVAVDYGADAVYIGGQHFGLRAKAHNFSIEDMREGAKYAHERGVKVYVTINIFAHNYDIEGIKTYFEEIKDTGIDAIIVSDPGIFSLARKMLPKMEIHISTQANNTNYLTYQYWHEMGAKRVVAARELSMAELAEIREKCDPELEIEAFIHGAMCISYSGRCLLSAYFTGRDANHGACTHPCRWKFSVVEEERPGEYLPVEEDERGTYIFNSKDLCMIEYIPELIKAGVYSFKIEGRMKTALYVAAVTRTYRKAIDDYLKSPELYKQNIESYKDEISACTFRQFTTGFYFGKPDHETQIYDSNTYIKNYTYIGMIEDFEVISGDDDSKNVIKVEFSQKNKFLLGDEVEVMTYDRNLICRVSAIEDEKGNAMESAPHPKQKLFVTLTSDEDLQTLVKRKMIIRQKCDENPDNG